MDPHFFLPCFHGQRAWAIKGKNSVHNLQYGPRTRLIRGIYIPYLFEYAQRSERKSAAIQVRRLFEDFHSSKREKFTHFIIVKSDLIPVVSLYGELNYSSFPKTCANQI